MILVSKARTFRLYPEPGRTLYVRVNVHQTKKAMLEYWRASSVLGFRGGTWRNRVAYCSEWVRWTFRSDRARKDPCFAEVNFYRAMLGTDIVTHEFEHATIAWGRRVNFPWARLGDEDSVNTDEERLAYVHGRLCSQFVDRAVQANVYDNRWRYQKE